MKYYSIILIVVLSCNTKVERDGLQQSSSQSTLADLNFIENDFVNGIEDSIRHYYFLIDSVIQKTISDMQVIKGRQEITENLKLGIDSISHFFNTYKASYRNNIKNSSETLFYSVGLNSQNFNDVHLFEYRSLLIEYAKIKKILKEICGNYFEILNPSDTSTIIPNCLFSY